VGHVISDRKKLLHRIRRIKGQLDAVERSLEGDAECVKIIHGLSACRGAVDALTAEVIKDHIRHHVVSPGRDPRSREARAARELIGILKTYLR
jgi:DNA-binding FrmR family transcriptional regulator